MLRMLRSGAFRLFDLGEKGERNAGVGSEPIENKERAQTGEVLIPRASHVSGRVYEYGVTDYDRVMELPD